MSLFDGLLQADEPAPTTEKPLPSCVIYVKRASNGADILLCSVTPPPATALAEARQRNLALFTLDEIPAMRRAGADDPRYIDTLIAARRKFGWGGLINYKAAA